MKTDKEMADSILCKVNDIKEERKMMKGRSSRTAALICAFALVFVAVFSLFIGPAPADEEIKPASAEISARKNAFLLVASAAYDTETPINKGYDVSLPLGGILTVNKAEGMNSREKDIFMLELKDRLTELYGKDCDWHIRGTQQECTVYFGTADSLKVKVEDSENVDNISVSCTDCGTLTVSDKSMLGSSLPSEYIKTVKQGTSITVTGKEYAEIYEKNDGLPIEWFLSENTVKTFKVSPETPLSAVKDEITIKVSYTDSSTQTYTISLSFDDEGILSAKCSSR